MNTPTAMPAVDIPAAAWGHAATLLAQSQAEQVFVRVAGRQMMLVTLEGQQHTVYTVSLSSPAGPASFTLPVVQLAEIAA